MHFYGETDKKLPPPSAASKRAWRAERKLAAKMEPVLAAQRPRLDGANFGRYFRRGIIFE